MATRIPPLPWATLTIPPANRLNNVGQGADARQISAAGSRSVVPLTYGRDRIGGLLLNVLPATTGSTTILVQVLWGFAGSAVEELQFNGLALPSAATVTTYLGTQTEPDAALVAAFAAQSITYADSLEGFAYSVLALPQGAIGTELQFTALFSGRKVYDPRKDSTAGGSGSHRLATPSTWEWSDCPALALADFLRNTVYGAAETVNSASVAAVANANDATVGAPAEKRRLVGVTFINPASVGDVAEALRAYAGCFLLPGANGIKLLADAPGSAVATYRHADGDIASIEPLQLRDLGNSPTVMEVIYTDTTVVPWRDASAFAELPGAGTTLPYRLSQVRLPGVHRYSQARREAIERLNKLTLQDLSTVLEVFDIGIRHERGDIVSVSHPIGITNKLFRVTDLESPRAGFWALALIEYDPACYSDAVETVPTYANSGALISEAPGGGSGISSYMIEIYAQAEEQPATPQGGQYTFVGDVFVPPSVSSGDPSPDNVGLLLSFDGTDGSTTFVDSSPRPKTLTALANAQIDTAQKRFGTGSLLLDGVSHVTLPDTDDLTWGAGDFTVECWIRPASIPGSGSYMGIFGQRVAFSTENAWMLYLNGDLGGALRCDYSTNGNGSVGGGAQGAVPAVGVWSHIAAVRQGPTLRVYVNGVGGAPHNIGTSAIFESGSAFSIGILSLAGPGSNCFSGHVDELRAKKGEAVYTNDFTPPDAPLGGDGGVGGEEVSWSRDQPEGSAVPTWASRYLVQTETPDVPVDIPLLDSWSVPNKHVQDGEGGAVLYLTATSQTFTFGSTGAAVPTSQTITFTAVAATLTGTATFTGTLFDASGASLGAATLGGSGLTRTLTVANFGVAQRCVVTVTLAGFSDSITVVRLRDGAGSVVGLLTNESVTVAADAAGVVASLAGTGGTFLVFDGLVSKTGDASVTYSVEAESGVDVSIASTGVYTVNSLSADSGSATLRAVYAGVTIDKVFSIAKARAGASGLNGVVVLAYQRSASGAPALPSVAATYTFATATLTGLNNGWSATIPAGTNPLYVTGATARSAAATDTIAAAEWSSAELLSANGLNNAAVLLFQRTTTATPPPQPSANVTYTFATGVASGLTEGWLQALPTTGGSYRWVINATALSAGPTDVLAPLEWSSAALLSEDGNNGNDAYVLELDNSNVTVPADLSGFVTSYTAAKTSIRVIKGGTTDDTANWTLAKADGAGIVSTLTGNVLAATSLTNDVGAVQVTATRAGFAELRGRFTVTRARSATSVSGPLTGGYYQFSVDRLPPTAVGVFFETDGTVKGGDSSIAYPVVGNWYAPTTAGVGATHWIRMVPRAGASVLDFGAINTWEPMSPGLLWAYEVPSGISPKAGIFDYEISTSSSGTPVVGGGVVDLFAGVGN